MLKKVIKYVDFDDVEKTETFYFNLTKAELIEMEVGEKEGLSVRLARVVADLEKKELVAFFREFILRAYGEKLPDGKFIKSKEISEAFSHSEAYSQLFIDLTMSEGSEKVASAFVNGLIPQTPIVSPVIPEK